MTTETATTTSPGAPGRPARVRTCLLAAGAAILLGAAGAIVLNWPRTALATPHTGGWVTGPSASAFFEAIRVLAQTDSEGEDAKVKIIAREPSDVYVSRITVAPGNNSGWHTHPGPSVVVVGTGTATVYEAGDEGCNIRTVPAGSGFIDQGGGHVHLVANQGTATLELFAFQIIPHGVPRVIDAGQPGQCPVL